MRTIVVVVVVLAALAAAAIARKNLWGTSEGESLTRAVGSPAMYCR